LKTSDFDYNLPQEYIAQTPIEPRHDSRLLVLHRDPPGLAHAHFRDLGRFLTPGDLLVLNETRVIPARVFAHKLPGGGRVELLLLRRLDLLTWETLVGGKGMRLGRQIQIKGGPPAEVVDELEGSRRLVRFVEPIETYLDQIGHVPLPPYIHALINDPARYQTVYAREPGSAAAPTAGLHFTPQLLDSLARQGIEFARVILHIGLDTFAPVNEDDPQDHHIHTEWCEIPESTAHKVNQVRKAGKRLIAVGTTSVRALETAAQTAGKSGEVESFTGPTDLFILPGYEFQVVDAMITNFHLPRSTLLMLVSAFTGRERILAAYEIAKQNRYRFYSFGDAMLII
jgi:S-adenosylmethionine:tRNA ribosyltransferase-isomerase